MLPPDLIIHTVLMVAIVSGYFWVYLVPTIRDGLHGAIVGILGKPVERAVASDCRVLRAAQAHFADKAALYADDDLVLTRTNAVMFWSNLLLVFMLMLLAAAWLAVAGMLNWHLAYAALEVALTYTLVITIQMWFINAVAKKYIPFTDADVQDMLAEGALRHCLAGAAHGGPHPPSPPDQ